MGLVEVIVLRLRHHACMSRSVPAVRVLVFAMLLCLAPAVDAAPPRHGELTGDVTAESVLLQARIQDTLTEEQRATLEKRAQQQREQMRKMQEQMRQQQGGQ